MASPRRTELAVGSEVRLSAAGEERFRRRDVAGAELLRPGEVGTVAKMGRQRGQATATVRCPRGGAHLYWLDELRDVAAAASPRGAAGAALQPSPVPSPWRAALQGAQQLEQDIGRDHPDAGTAAEHALPAVTSPPAEPPARSSPRGQPPVGASRYGSTVQAPDADWVRQQEEEAQAAREESIAADTAAEAAAMVTGLRSAAANAAADFAERWGGVVRRLGGGAGGWSDVDRLRRDTIACAEHWAAATAAADVVAQQLGAEREARASDELRHRAHAAAQKQQLESTSAELEAVKEERAELAGRLKAEMELVEDCKRRLQEAERHADHADSVQRRLTDALRRIEEAAVADEVDSAAAAAAAVATAARADIMQEQRDSAVRALEELRRRHAEEKRTREHAVPREQARASLLRAEQIVAAEKAKNRRLTVANEELSIRIDQLEKDLSDLTEALLQDARQRASSQRRSGRDGSARRKRSSSRRPRETPMRRKGATPEGSASPWPTRAEEEAVASLGESVSVDSVQWPSLGVELADAMHVGPSICRTLRYDGIRVVSARRPAAPSVRQGDVVVKVNGIGVSSLDEFREAVAGLTEGQSVHLTVRRQAPDASPRSRATETTVTVKARGGEIAPGQHVGVHCVTLRDTLGSAEGRTTAAGAGLLVEGGAAERRSPSPRRARDESQVLRVDPLRLFGASSPPSRDGRRSPAA
eukprot:TRINITY_DN9171_c0_g1_i8.p1 TRINITY_DN9171_c0_g1~~TRINITY_DN9171_c0_g1_i8.p1  ORF type:complete len:704 (+),score=277.74 TRINITY_DN9171_c0_g1_i8:1441-3552(+)